MRDVDLVGKHFATFGKKNTGKSFLNNWLMKSATRPYLVFDPLREHTDYTEADLVVIPEYTRGDEANRELQEIIEFAIENRQHFGYIWVDEVNRFHGKGGTLDGPIGDVVDLNAHYNLGVGMIARRPVQVHTDIIELADYLFVFKLTGVNDIRKLDNISSGLGERVATLRQREFMVVYPDGSYSQMNPIRDTVQHSKGV